MDQTTSKVPYRAGAARSPFEVFALTCAHMCAQYPEPKFHVNEREGDEERERG